MLTKIALALWIVSAGLFGWFIYKGQTMKAPESERIVVVLDPVEREYVLAEMRGMLSAVQQILLGIANNDRTAIARAASAAGMSVAADDSPRLLTKLPMEMKALGFGVHRDMDALAEAAQKGVPYNDIVLMLGTSMGKCVACHQTWQLGR